MVSLCGLEYHSFVLLFTSWSFSDFHAISFLTLCSDLYRHIKVVKDLFIQILTFLLQGFENEENSETNRSEIQCSSLCWPGTEEWWLLQQLTHTTITTDRNRLPLDINCRSHVGSSLCFQLFATLAAIVNGHYGINYV